MLAVVGTGDDFKVLDSKCSFIRPGEICIFSLAFAPTSAGVQDKLASVAGKPSESASFRVRGVGVEPLARAVDVLTKDFGSVAIGTESKPELFKFTNQTETTKFLGAVTIAGDDFAFTANGADACTNKELAAGASCEASVVFRPRSAGAKTGTLSFGPKVDVALSGVGQTTGP